MEAALITLLTDFGHKDPYVGIMKGVIFGINPTARVIDLSHGVPPQDLLAGALMLRHAAPYFPRGTIHVAIVDPGVGSERRPLLMEAEGSFFIGPDNGLLSLAFDEKEPRCIIELSNQIYHLKPTSMTFHGRDIFAPIAAYLSLGMPPPDFGPAVREFRTLPWPEIAATDRAIWGEVVYIDGFGNLVTNVEERTLRAFQADRLTFSLGPLTIHGLAPNYSAASDRDYLALVNSWGLLEIALYKGNAHLSCGAKIGDKVDIRTKPENWGKAP